MHLTEQEIAAYRAPGMAPEQILRLRRHVDACAECRAKVGDRPGDAAVLRRLLVGEPDEHELTLLAAGQLPPDYARELRAHVESCPKCAEIVAEAEEDFRALRAVHRPAARQRAAPAWWMGLAAATLLGVCGLLWLPARRPAPPAGPQASLHDGPRTIALTASGSLEGLSGLQEPEREWISDALATGRLALAGGLPVEKPGVLRGSQTEAGFRLLAPLNVRLVADRPEFRWERLPGAASYSVKVFTEDERIVARGETGSNLWQPGEPLPRQVRLAWQVTAMLGASLVTAPHPPAPQAIFELISAEAAARIERALADSPPSHVLLASLYAREGMIDDARRELAALEAANPGSSLVHRWRDSLGPEDR